MRPIEDALKIVAVTQNALRVPNGRANSRKSRTVRVVLLSALCGVVLWSCGASEPTSASSADAGATSSASGAPSDVICDAGATRECVGPGACRGGQFCERGAWSACDCGGGASNTGGASSGDEAGTGNVVNVAGSGENSGGSQGGVASEDDPCPVKLVQQCAPDCDPNFYPCEPAASCGVTSPVGVVPDEYAEAIVYRLPRASELRASCTCETGAAVATQVMVEIIGPTGLDLKHGHLRVRPPWHVWPEGANPEQGGCAPAVISQCAPRVAGFWTDDPNAPSINVNFEPGNCPAE